MLSEQANSDSGWHPGFAHSERWAFGTGGSPQRETSTLGTQLVYVLGTRTAGSGGNVPSSLPWCLLTPSGFPIFARSSSFPPFSKLSASPHVAPSLSRRVAAIRHYLSLTITDLARVLRVERPTVYAWIAETSRPHDQNLVRIWRIYELACAWRSLSTKPLGKLIREPVGGASLLDLLSSANLPTAQIREVLRSCADLQRTSPESVPKGGLTDALRSHKFGPLPDEQRQDSFDQETSF